MTQIIECVPNFSEGRDLSIIDQIANSISSVNGVKLLGVEPDRDYNRTVVTFVGSAESVKEAAYQSTIKAFELIDMQKHHGEHPRIGAVDVVPFIPVSNTSMEECVEISKEYAKRVAEKYDIPIYLYAEASTKPQRVNLSDIRKGEYEGLKAKLEDPNWYPDFGKPIFNPKIGALVTGARFFLIAYNVNLNTDDSSIAHEIALRIRESGRPKKNEKGEFVLDESGKKIIIPGSLKQIKAMGVLLERYHIAQVSINVMNYLVTPPHIAFEEVKKEAKTLGVEVTGSEIVGLTPKEALLMAGRFYASKESNQIPTNEKELIKIAIDNLGLSQLEEFIPEKKIIEYMI
ncbi:MAG TPA: glutamate formimidoyltransferase [Bacteroidota bacterium]|nr:glutamate formimidoyltransferase [Bacteroidota bacterium]